MSNFIIEIVEPVINKIAIETSFLDNVTNKIEIERYDTINLNIINTEKVLVGDLPDNIPMSKISGNLYVSRIEGLDDYLNAYSFDCGTP